MNFVGKSSRAPSVHDGNGDDRQCCCAGAWPSSSTFSLTTSETVVGAVKRWRTTRRALPAAVCVAAAAALAVVVLVSSAGGDYEMPASLFFDGTRGSEDNPPSNLTDDQLLGGLLLATFSEGSCRSRYEFAGYHKLKPRGKPSLYLIAKLRKQEALQKQCGPGTAPYKKALRQLKSGSGAAGATDCHYLVSIGYRGLGNRMLAIASAFLYAVLTERVLLVDGYKLNLGALFCEPFPGTTWLLPAGRRFPLGPFADYDGDSKESLGNLLKTNTIAVEGGTDGNNKSWSPPPYIYLHLAGGYSFHDKLFFCDEQQLLLRGVPWLLMKTDGYLIPGLFLIPAFQEELEGMFPEKDTAFHHLGRYLFHPANAVWNAVTSYYRAHMAGVGQLVGIQIRVFQRRRPPTQQILDQVLSCTRREQLLPRIATKKMNMSDQAVLVTSLSSWYYEMIKEEYDGVVAGGVHQPSHEGRQRRGDTTHDMRALSEMYLLSTCDVLLTSGFSTFGYVAQGLAGVRPWVMPRRPMWDENTDGAVPEPPCVRAASVEPCFHSPSYYNCTARKDYAGVDQVVPYVRRCEDVSWGIKLVNGSSQW